MAPIVRLTLFKIPDAGDIAAASDKFSTLTQDAKKDGKPYITSASLLRAHANPRDQGYTLVARTTFDSKADMEYYENECEAHAAIRAALKGKVAAPPLVVYGDA